MLETLAVRKFFKNQIILLVNQFYLPHFYNSQIFFQSFFKEWDIALPETFLLHENILLLTVYFLFQSNCFNKDEQY